MTFANHEHSPGRKLDFFLVVVSGGVAAFLNRKH